MPLGLHVTISPRPIAGIREAEALGADTIQIFTHNPRGWSFKPLDQDALVEFKAAAKAAGISPIVSHCNYLINLATTDNYQWKQSVDCLKREFAYAQAFGCDHFVLHVGKHKGMGVKTGIKQVIAGIHAVKKELLGSGVTLLLETVAGQGTEVGVDFQDLNRIIDGLDADVRAQVGVCMDTCHVFAAGYDVSTRKGVDDIIVAIKKSFGFGRLRVLHLNDAKGELGGHLDRHAHIGMGNIGTVGFKELLKRPEFRDLPMILETPIDDGRGYAENIATVRELLS